VSDQTVRLVRTCTQYVCADAVRVCVVCTRARARAVHRMCALYHRRARMPTTLSCCRRNARARRAEHGGIRTRVKSVDNSVIDEDYADDDDRIVRIDDRAIDIRADNVHLREQVSQHLRFLAGWSCLFINVALRAFEHSRERMFSKDKSNDNWTTIGARDSRTEESRRLFAKRNDGFCYIGKRIKIYYIHSKNIRSSSCRMCRSLG